MSANHTQRPILRTAVGTVFIVPVSRDRVDVTDSRVRFGRRPFHLAVSLKRINGRWRTYPHALIRIEHSDGGRTSANVAAVILRAVVAAVAAWADCHAGELLRAERAIFAIDKRGLTNLVSSLIESLDFEAEVLHACADDFGVASASPQARGRMLRLAATLQEAMNQARELGGEVRAVRYQAAA